MNIQLKIRYLKYVHSLLSTYSFGQHETIISYLQTNKWHNKISIYDWALWDKKKLALSIT